ncbi:IclR family transcriptional regulator [Halodurantibacterium flavum]|uniref:IclR family transcriptional regulator n=1 Tax=Halodurantibacterium flavum TaxID=1382802 RepID=A0ABW4S760_9RHOB
MDNETERRRGVQSVEVSVGILLALSGASGPMTLSQIAVAVEMAPAKAHRYLASLVETGMVQHRKSGTYDLGAAAARIGTAAIARIDVVNRAADALPDLVEHSGCTGMLSVWGAFGATVVRWEKSSAQLITALGVGSTLPMLHSATGRSFMAWLPERLAIERLAIEAPDMDPGSFSDLRQAARREVVTEALQTFIPGLYALAIPVLDVQGYAEAVITLVSNRPEPLAVGSDGYRTMIEHAETFVPRQFRQLPA